MKDIPIIYEDENLLVLNKPAGVFVHGDGRGESGQTIADWLIEKHPNLQYVGESMVMPDGTKIDRPGIVHRLDKDTTGVLLVAKDQLTYEHLKGQFQNRKIKKIYFLLTAGVPKLRHDEREGVINIPIGRSGSDARKRAVGAQAVGEKREALTYYRVLEALGQYAYIEAHPKSGRTHQIRVHFQAIGCPVVGDLLYGGREAKTDLIGRQALHAGQVDLTLSNGREMTFKAPLPEDFQFALEKLREAC